MTPEKVTITTETTKEALIGYIKDPCIRNWRTHATYERKGKPIPNDGVCGKCMFRGFLEQYMMDNADASRKIKTFMTDVRQNPEMYPRISSLLKK